MNYDHTQKAPLYLLLLAIAAASLVLAWLCRAETAAVFISVAVAVVLLAAAGMFRQLTVRDEGQWLAIRYGPLPVFRQRIPYADITSVESARSSVLDGWGIHYIPGRGTTYNLWGFACAQLLVKGRIVRVGSDDVENLVAFLRAKISG